MSLPTEIMNQNKKVVAIIQARMTSSRLPGKVMKEISGFPMLFHVINRVSKSRLINQIIIATTDDTSDDEIQKYCDLLGFTCFRGHPYDVLDRFYHAAKLYNAEIIVRVTADCPIIDPEVIDSLIKTFLESDVDFVANRLPPPWERSFPIGLDVEITSFPALEEAWNKAKTKFEREHVMPYLYVEPGRFKTLIVQHEPDYGKKRFTVDTPEDLEFIRLIFDHFSPKIDFSWIDVINFLSKNPQLEKINQSISAKKITDVDNRFMDVEEQS